MSQPSVSIVLPAYNESARLLSSLHALVEHVNRTDTEIIVVDDGSVDDTAAIAETALRDGPLSRVLRLERNSGKGAAVRTGVLAAQGDNVVYMDADLATDLEDLKPLLIALDDADVAVGSRTAPDATVINGTMTRAIMARCFNAIARPVTKLPLHDTQCGFKGFRVDAAKLLFRLATTNGFAFDVEILALAQQLGLRVTEVPVTWTAVQGSSVRNLHDPAHMTFDVIRIARQWRGSRARDAADRSISVSGLASVPDGSPTDTLAADGSNPR